MSESGSLSLVVEGILKLDRNEESLEDGEELIYINIRKAKGYERARKILNGENHPELVSLQQLHLQAVTLPVTGRGNTSSQTMQNGNNASSSGRTNRPGRISGGEEP